MRLAMVRNFARIAASGLAGLLLAAMPAAAASFTYEFTSDHCTGGCLPAGASNMGTVVVTDNGLDTVDVTVTLTSGFGFVLTGAGTGTDGNGAFFFRLTGNPQITYDLSDSSMDGWLIPNEITPDKQNAGAYSGGSLADEFEYALACGVAPPNGSASDACGPGASKIAPSPLMFSITAAGLTAASFNDPGTSGSQFAADVISTTGFTGLIDASCPVGTNCGGGDIPDVPEPSTILLMGGALLGLGLLKKKRTS